MDYSSLNWLIPTPRSIDANAEVMLDRIYPKPFFPSLRKGAMNKWRDAASRGQYVLAGVVQAARPLYSPSDSSVGGIVIVWSLDPRVSRDEAWLSMLAQRLSAYRHAPGSDPAAMQVAMKLASEQSQFHETLPLHLTDNIETRWCTGVIFANQLPGFTIPASRVLPVFVLPNLAVQFVPPALYGA